MFQMKTAWRLSKSWSGASRRTYRWKQMGTPMACAAHGGTVQTIGADALFPLADTTGTTLTLEQEPSPLRVSAQLHAPRR